MERHLLKAMLALLLFQAAEARADIRIGWQTAVANVVLTYGLSTGAFEREGAKTELKPFPAGPAMLPALAAREIDLAWMGEFPAVTGYASGLPISVVAVQALLPTDVRLVVNPQAGITGLGALKGKRIGITIGSTSHNHVLLALKAAGLVQGDVTLVNLAPANMVAAYSAGQVDAVFTWEPGSGEVESRGGLRLATTESLGSVTGLFAVARTEFVKTDGPELAAFLRGWDSVLEVYRRDPKTVLAPEAARLNMSVDDLASLIGRQQASFPALSTQLTPDQLGAPDGEGSRLLRHFGEIGAFLLAEGRIQKLPPSFAPLIDRGPLTTAVAERRR